MSQGAPGNRFTLRPIEGDSYKGEQWGYMIELDGHDFLRASMGGTGDCWNIQETSPTFVGGEMVYEDFHICDLDDFIAALEALRDSDAHKANIERRKSK